MRATLLLIAGILAVFSAHVGLPYLYVGVDRAGLLPHWLSAMTEAIDPAIWAILLPFSLACIGYNYVLRYCGISGLASRRLFRWPIAFATAFLSLWAEMDLMFNTYGS